MDGLMKRIEDHRSRFSKGQKRIADYIIRSYDKAAFMTAAQLGEMVGVSESTVVRFTYTIGLDGYPKLQEALQEMMRHRMTTVQRIQIAQEIPREALMRTILLSDAANVRATADMVNSETFDSVVQAIMDARRIYVIGIRSAAALAQFFAYYLDFVCDDVMLVSGGVQEITERLIRIRPEDVCFGFNFPRYSVHTVDAMRFAKKQGATVITLTDNMGAPSAAFSDYTLCAKSDIASFTDSLTAPMSLINAILAAVGYARTETASRHLSKLEQIWSNEKIYMTDGMESR